MLRALRHSTLLSGVTVAALTTQLVTSCAESAVLPPGELPSFPSDAAVDDVATIVPDVVAAECKPKAWCRVTLPRSVTTPLAINGIWGTGPDNVWLVGSPAVAFHWTGKTLEPESFDTRFPLVGIWGSGPNDVWTFGTTTTLWHRGDEGDAGSGQAAWSRSSGLTGKPEGGWPTPISAMWGRNATDVWAVGASVTNGFIASPTVYHSTGWRDGDPSWQVSPTSSATPSQVEAFTFNAICGAEQTGVWIVGQGGKTRFSEGWSAEGGNWHTIDSHTSQELFATWCSGGLGADVWAVGEGGVIRRFTREDGGSYAVSSVATPTKATLRALWGAAPDDIWAVGDRGTIVHWDGQSWKLAEAPLDTATTQDLFTVWQSTTGDLWIAGRDVILHNGAAPLPGAPL